MARGIPADINHFCSNDRLSEYQIYYPSQSNYIHINHYAPLFDIEADIGFHNGTLIQAEWKYIIWVQFMLENTKQLLVILINILRLHISKSLISV